MWLGDVLEARFVIERPIGKGGMGSVYLANDRKTGVSVAVKVMDSVGAALDDRFAREAAALGQVAHPAVVRYVSSGRTESGEAYLVMEWLDGESLESRLSREALSLRDCLAVTRRAAEGLAAAHASGVLHRDVKPSNLYLVEGDPARLKVVDFGIARLDAEPGALTRTGALLGTVGYMAPEQARDAKRATDRADVFSLGCVLFECLTGHPPFKGATPVAVLSRLLVEDVPAPSTLRPGLPPSLDELVLALLARAPELRPPATLVATLAAALEHQITTDPIAPTVALAARPAATGERWTATVLYARAPTDDDSMGTTDAATVHAAASVSGLARAVTETAGAFGGAITPIDGRTWLVTFPERGPATDRARRAAVCALALRDAGLERVVVATARDDSTAHRVTGPAIDRAAELLETTGEIPKGAVLLDALTASLVDTAFDVDRTGEQPLLIGGRADQGVARLLMGKRTPFVGREKELAVLEATLAECLDEVTARVVLVTAPPGTGKSRLRMELVARATRRGDVKVLLGRGEIGTGVSFAVARQLVTAAAGLSPDLAPDDRARRLEAHIASLLPFERAREVAEFLVETLALPFSGPPSPAMRSARLDSETMAALVLDAFDGWLAAERAASPLLVVIEDLHWADSATVDLLVRAARVKSPALFLVALARPEAAQLFPTLSGLDVTLPLRLPGLGARSAERLVRAALGDHATQENVARVIALADGNAFFIEELVRAVVEGRSAELPESVLSMAEARLAALEPEARSVLRAASVLGERFAVEAVGELVGEVTSVREWCETLADREVLERPGGERAGGTPEFLFRHALLREAAYAQLNQADKTRHHARAGAWLERQSAPDPIAVADHWECAGDATRAVSWLATAAEAAWDASDVETGRKIVARGLALHAEGVDRGRLRSVDRWCAETHERAFEAAADAVTLLPDGSDGWVQAVGQAMWSGLLIGRHEAAQYLSPLLRHIARPIARTPRVAYALWIAVAVTGMAGRFDIMDRFVGALDEPDPGAERDPLFEIFRLQLRATAAVCGGKTLDGMASAAAALPGLARQARTPRARHHASHALGHALVLLGVWHEAIPALLEALTHDGTLGQGSMAAWLARAQAESGAVADAHSTLLRYSGASGVEGLILENQRGWVLLRGGQLQEAAAHCRALESAAAAYPTITINGYVARSAAALERGEPAEALALAETGLSREGGTPDLAPTLRLHRVLALSALGRDTEARDALRDARDRLFALRDTIEDPVYRARYVDAFVETREIVRLAAEWFGESA